uniref:Putative tail tape measure protein n=1 Tax=viral metagenome TaxID=1070528 RepID=A0A6M3IU01_9ZZZZ
MPDERIQAVIQVQADVEQARRAFESLSAAVAGLTQDVSAQARAAQDAQARMNALTGTARALGMGLAAAGAAGTAFSVSNVMLAARVETLGVVVNRLGQNLGYSARQMRQFETAVKSQGITTQAARQSLAQMAQANLDLGKAADLARVAQDAAVIAGINSSEAFQRLVYAISSGQVEMLRTMGIQVQFNAGYAEMAATLGKSTSALTAEERVQARMNTVLDAGTSIAGAYSEAMGTAGKQITSMPRLIEEAQLALGEGLLPAMSAVIGVTGELLTKFNELEPATKQGTGAALATASAFSAVGGAGLILVSKIPSIVAGFKAMGLAASTSLGPIGLVAGAIAAATIALVAHGAAQRAARQGMIDLAGGVTSLADSYAGYRQEVLDAAEAQSQLHTAHEYIIDSEGQLIERFVTRAGWQERVVEGVHVLTEAEWEGGAAAQAAAAGQEGLEGAIRDVGSAADDSAQRMAAYWRASSGGAQSAIDAAREHLDWVLQGGPQIDALIGQITRAVQEGRITPEEGREMFYGVDVALSEMAVKAGDDTRWGAARGLAEAWGIPFGTARDDLSEALSTAETFPREISIQVRWNWGPEGAPPGWGGGGGGGGGGTSVVGAAAFSARQAARYETRAAGGPLSRGWTLVGEGGPELIAPTGVVVPHPESQRLIHAGLVMPEAHHMIDWGATGGGYTPPRKTTPVGGKTGGELKSGIPGGTVTGVVTPGVSGLTTGGEAAAMIASTTSAAEQAAQNVASAMMGVMPQPEEIALSIAAPNRAMAAASERTGAATNRRLDKIIEVLMRLGTAEDTARAVMDGIARVQG